MSHAGFTFKHIAMSCIVILAGFLWPDKYMEIFDLAHPSFSAKSAMLMPHIASCSLAGEKTLSLLGTSIVPPSVFHIVSHVVSKIKKKVHFVIDMSAGV
jgi:hypothetical protein